MPKTVLIADDQPHIRLLVRTTLDGGAYRILEAADGRQALEIAREEAPDLVVLDWMMPELSGIQVLEKLRQNPETAATPVVMLTAKAQERDRREAVLLGVRAFLVKPFSPLELIDRVEKALKKPSELK